MTFLIILGALVLAIAIDAGLAWVLMMLGNFILGAIGSQFVLTFWVAWAIMIVFDILTSGIRAAATKK